MSDVMDRGRWQHLERLCELALTVPLAARRALLQDACPADESLVHDALALAREADEHPGFLESPLVDVTSLATEQLHVAPDVLPDRLGPYAVQQRLGAGGMAEVFQAVRDVDGVSQTVAIKVMRRGTDTDELLRRFRLERRILASLSHPNISGLLDAGVTSDGRPYVVMEFVDGAPITSWCDAHTLPVAARLTLFLDVCAAVQHAHQHVVVHRDIKPSNILVTEDRRPVLLDFGIGKVLGSDALGSLVETTAGDRLHTPQYASPEQVTGGAITTATDVYALGVLLYELLSGCHPFPAGDRTRGALDQAILEALPPALSDGVTPDAAEARAASTQALRRQLNGDIATIVQVALRKEPARRYPTVTALADDVRRYLAGRPVQARADSVGYRLQRFVGRHTAAVIVGSVAALLLAGSTALVYRQSRIVALSAERVALQRDRAREVRGFLLETFGASGADRAVGDTVSVRRLLDLQTAQVPLQFAGRTELQADMFDALAEAYDRLGLPAEAEPLARRAVDLRRAADPEGVATLNDALPASLSLHGWLLHVLGRSDEGEPLLLEAIAARRADPDATEGLSRSLNDLGVLYNATARYADAERVLSEALELREQESGGRDRPVGITANNLAATYYYLGRFEDAAQTQDRAVEALTAAFGDEHQRTILALSNLATFRLQAGDLAGATKGFRTLLARQSRLQGASHPLTSHVKTALAQVLFDRAVLDRETSSLAEADTLVRSALVALENRLGANHPTTGRARHQLAMILQQQGSLADAQRSETRAIATLSAALGPNHPTTLTARHGLIRILRARGEFSSAIRRLEEIADELAVAPEATPGLRTERARADAAACELFLGVPDPTFRRSALAACDRAVAALAPLPETVARLRAKTTMLRDSARRIAVVAAPIP